ncbi:ABC transporter permease [Abyssisolibacter fermentans]|uniref:ABC transporter permease n=1 Tax=Abyssisolibacter fermentans TaxID=1766203 RepID=UPI0008311D08|nr:ABC transporter permease [Abyssisolibacter fermentans]
MLKQFTVLLKKDVQLVIRHKFILIMIASIIVYSLYINFVYISKGGDTTNTYVLLENQYQMVVSENEKLTIVKSEEALYDALKTDTDGVGIRVNESGNPYSILLYHVSDKSDKNKALYSLNKLMANYDSEVPITYLEKGNLELKQRSTMTSVIVFFEITAISFLGVASLFFKEKSMGVIKVYGILPGSKLLYIASKVLLFLFLEIIFVVTMCFINIGVEYSLSILPEIILQVILLSPIMVMLGFLFSVIYNNFKQFIFAYTVIVVLVTSPVFLFVTSSLDWKGIYILPTYYAFSALYNVFMKKPDSILSYALICMIVILGLTIINYRLMKREIERG